MPDYWLDSDALITPKNGPYGFDIAPGFWEFIERKVAEGSIRSPAFVYGELIDGGDELAAWAKEQKNAALFVDPDQEVQLAMTDVASFVQRQYDSSEAKRFLDGADPWVVACAKAHGGEVVTFEVSAPASKKVKIPDVSRQFGVTCVNTYQMLRSLGAKFR